MADCIHRCGFQLGLWTVNKLDELHHFATAGVDALTTDRPDLFAGDLSRPIEHNYSES